MHPVPDPADVDDRLVAHLRSWLGAWPPQRRLHVAGSGMRTTPGWDGIVRAFNGVATPGGTVLSVPPSAVATVEAAAEDAGGDLAAVGERLAEILDRPGAVFGSGIFRWSTDPVPSDDPGVWLRTDDARVPHWLHPFNGDVLVAFEDGAVAAGVGRKQHDRNGHELAVVTEEAFRGRGYARRLVTQAARRVLDDGAVPVYLHAPDNEASARTADAAGFPDVGWRILGLFGGRPEDAD